MIRWSSTSMKTFHLCPRKFRHRYILNLEDPSSQAQEYGTAMHAGLEAWLLSYSNGEQERMESAMTAINGRSLSTLDHVKCRAMMRAYEARWGQSTWTVLGAESEFEFELDGVEIRGKIDGIVRDDSDGRVYVVEHKNTSSDISPGSTYWDKLSVETQVSLYWIGAESLGHEVDGVVYDVLARPRMAPMSATPEQKRKYTKGTKNEPPRLYAGQRDTDESWEEFECRLSAAIAENPDAYLRRAIVVRSSDDMARVQGAVTETVRLARLCEVIDLFPQNFDSCHAYGTACHYLPICVGATDVTDPRYQKTED